MIKRLKQFLATLALSAGLLVPLAVPVSVGASTIQDNLCSGVNLGEVGSGTDCAASDDAGTNVNTIVTDVVNFLSWFVGIVSVIMIIVGGFRYITSGGSNDKVTSAKNTIVYAIIGLIIVALAQFIVNFVIDRVTTTGTE